MERLQWHVKACQQLSRTASLSGVRSSRQLPRTPTCDPDRRPYLSQGGPMQLLLLIAFIPVYWRVATYLDRLVAALPEWSWCSLVDCEAA